MFPHMALPHTLPSALYTSASVGATTGASIDATAGAFVDASAAGVVQEDAIADAFAGTTASVAANLAAWNAAWNAPAAAPPPAQGVAAVYINLDRRADRREVVEAELRAAGLAASRFRAHTGDEASEEEVARSWDTRRNARYDTPVHS